MKWVWIVVGAVVVVCGACGVGGYFLYTQGKGAWDEAKKYGDESLVAIAKPWNARALIERAAPELIRQNPDGTLEQVVKQLQVLGPMKSFTSSITAFHAKSTTEAGTYLEAKYQADAVFEKGPGRITMTLIKRGESWKILTFYGSST
ncbi:MAG TPA: hypothetical protein PLO61_00175 [Fimbriimonadaceae bacterium]|nr:hypothetical protein [Fimbriimonadaceae bacterium]HRJ33503.1 hypothetical protein [Fimbriimonadaceae bacterium]